MGSRFDLLNDGEEILYEDANNFEPYPNEKIRMKLHEGEKRQQLLESIQKNGVLFPIIATPSNNRGKLIVIAGWNRVSICSELGLAVPYQLKTNLTQEQADLICIDTNLLNRQIDEVPVSELAWILKTRNDILKHQGKNTLDPMGLKQITTDKLSDDYKLSATNVKRYIRLTYLSEELLKMVDDKIIPFRVGVEISYLKLNEMSELVKLINKQKFIVTIKIAELLKKLSSETEENINVQSVINEYNSNISDNTNRGIKITNKELKQYIKIEDMSNAKEIIVKALQLYYDNMA